MKQYLAFITKEFRSLLRDYRTLVVLIGIPVVQIILFGFALSNEVKNTQVAVLDNARDAMTREIIAQLDASAYFEVVAHVHDMPSAEAALRSGQAKMVVSFPAKFAHDIAHGNNAGIQLLTDGSNPNLSTTIIQYASAIVRDYQALKFDRPSLPYDITIATRMLYNPQLRGEYTFVPGVMALVLMLICSLMTSVSIVKEKEMGNMEILLVSPLRPATIILSKTIPYLVLSLVILGVILGLSVFLLGVPIRGSVALLLGISTLFILASLSLGMVISTVTDSQQVAMLISLMGLMLPTIMLSGFMFPIESMPWVLQMVSNVVPAKWFYYGVSDVMIRGLGFEAVWREIVILVGFTIVFLVISFRKFNMRLT